MECRSKEASLALRAGGSQTFNSLPSSRTISSTNSLSDRESKHGQSSSELESPPTELINDCAQWCKGLWNGCSYGDYHQPYCRLRCSPRACKQCREVGDADWIRRGHWLEDCISLEEEDENQDVYTRQGGVNKFIAICAFAVICAGVFYWIYRARHILELT